MGCNDEATIAADLEAFVALHRPAAIISASCYSPLMTAMATASKLQIPLLETSMRVGSIGSGTTWRTVLSTQMTVRSLMAGMPNLYKRIAFVYDYLYNDDTYQAAANYQAAAAAAGIKVEVTIHALEWLASADDMAAVTSQALAEAPDAIFAWLWTFNNAAKLLTFIKTARAADPTFPLIMPGVGQYYGDWDDEIKQALAVQGTDGVTTYPLLGVECHEPRLPRVGPPAKPGARYNGVLLCLGRRARPYVRRHVGHYQRRQGKWQE
ncbi:hypothetical protein HYH03_002652 [Edaphochlamys debaryana]|uniref:Leucine-binding protein domain-containing protein n=1 Tax=Edaphochlamys debaryana TaxID=47281 RepID=A0A835YDP5_9CHLO|nr:hypothetical protein HYH03_002652 [Edaphochlamys debaryana]|eukprot:KAG2499717.1 hypothetical protein HYH03_002652 [Edaphochlamys debaryana]